MRDYFFLVWLFPKNKMLVKSLRAFSQDLNPTEELKNLYDKNLLEVEKLKKQLEAHSMGYITAIDNDYPENLKTCDYSPLIISYSGDINLLKSDGKFIGFIGSRRIDPELQYWFSTEVKKLHSDYIIVSGGAIGVDQFVHKESVKNNLKTVVILPSGLLNPYPKYFYDLFKDNKSFLFLSQFPPFVRVYKSNFYPRNYLIAGLCEKLVVLQAEKKSGTMVTARFAIDLNKDIYTLSNSPWDQRYSGNKELINSGAFQIMDLNLFQ